MVFNSPLATLEASVIVQDVAIVCKYSLAHNITFSQHHIRAVLKFTSWKQRNVYKTAIHVCLVIVV